MKPFSWGYPKIMWGDKWMRCLLFVCIYLHHRHAKANCATRTAEETTQGDEERLAPEVIMYPQTYVRDTQSSMLAIRHPSQ
jgi:hypothetical protein